ncbi:MAG: peptidoglycan DD-metalloendopeptidase family protein [Candidatus Margulisiibacteriota bacterium]
MSAAFAESEVASEKDKLKNIQEELLRQKQILEATKKHEQEALGQLAAVRKDLAKTTAELRQANQNIIVNESRIKNLVVELDASQKKLSSQGVYLRQRIKEVYKCGEGRYLDLIFGAKSMSDFVDRAYYFGKILEKDVRLISAIESEYKKSESQKNELSKTTKDIKKLAQVIKQKKGTIEEKEAEQKTLYDKLKIRRAEFERNIAELEKSSQQMEGLIARKIAERARAGLQAPTSSGQFIWPVKGRITSTFGYRRNPMWGGRNFHTGLDIANSYGLPISAADSGEIIFAGWWDGYGKAVVIDHGHGTSTLYGHMSRLYASTGQTVSKGQVIGLLGSTGYSTGPHLHFEVRKSGKPVNPRPFLP